MNRRVVAAVGIAVVVVIGVVVTRHNGGTTVAPASTDSSTAAIDGIGSDVGDTTSSSSVQTSVLTTTIPASPVNPDLGATDRLEQTQPLVHVLPHDTTHYKIDYRVVEGNRLVLTITLLTVLNHGRQLATYQDQLRQYKAEALEYLRSAGEDPTHYSISYEPPEAAAL